MLGRFARSGSQSNPAPLYLFINCSSVQFACCEQIFLFDCRTFITLSVDLCLQHVDRTLTTEPLLLKLDAFDLLLLICRSRQQVVQQMESLQLIHNTSK